VQFTNQLIRSPGIPDNWEENNTEELEDFVIGLAEKDRIISEKKLEEFEKLDYNLIKNVSNLGAYNFYFLLLKGNVSVVEIGSYPAGQSTKLRRNVLYKNETSIVEVSLWK